MRATTAAPASTNTSNSNSGLPWEGAEAEADNDSTEEDEEDEEEEGSARRRGEAAGVCCGSSIECPLTAPFALPLLMADSGRVRTSPP